MSDIGIVECLRCVINILYVCAKQNCISSLITIFIFLLLHKLPETQTKDTHTKKTTFFAVYQNCIVWGKNIFIFYINTAKRLHLCNQRGTTNIPITREYNFFLSVLVLLSRTNRQRTTAIFGCSNNFPVHPSFCVFSLVLVWFDYII